jgi:hypothetical protein
MPTGPGGQKLSTKRHPESTVLEKALVGAAITCFGVYIANSIGTYYCTYRMFPTISYKVAIANPR